jgi:hypothetical protein
MCVRASVSYLIAWWDFMRTAIQVALICWMTVLLAVTVRTQVLTDEQNGQAHMRIERELADHAARVSSSEAELRDFRAMRIPDRLAAIESTQQVNQYILVSILLSVIVLLLKDIRSWVRKSPRS